MPRLSATTWTTEKVEQVIKGVDTVGKMPKDTPFYEGDTDWKTADIIWGYTAHEMAEITKCNKDILYFGETYASVMTDDGVRVVKLRDYQKKCLVQFHKYRKNILLSSRQSGKCVTGTTYLRLLKNHTVTSPPIYELFFRNSTKKTWFYNILYTLYKILEKIERVDYIDRHRNNTITTGI